MKNKELRTKNSELESGYTMIELLAVMIVLVTVGVIMVGILASSFRGANKTSTLNTVRQNGSYALDQMAGMIRNAKSLNSPYPCVIPPAPTPSPTPVSSITITAFDGGVTTLNCTGTTIASVSAAGSVSLLDSSVVSLESCQFTCSQNAFSDFPTIGIEFYAKQAGVALLPEKTASATAIPFRTSVSIRNTQR